MRITAINGSPKGEKSNSMEIISILKGMMPGETEWRVISQIKEYNPGYLPDREEIYDSEVLLIVFPLYVDGLPASLMRFLSGYALGYGRRRDRNRVQRVFAVANCGFHEGNQNTPALSILEHYCQSANLNWCGGIGIGTGEMIRGLSHVPSEAGIRRPVFKVLEEVAGVLKDPRGRLKENLYAQHKFPWLLYKISGEWGWRFQLKKNGGRWNQINARPLAAKIPGNI